MTNTEAIDPYSQQQHEIVRLHDRYRRCLMDQKYYAWRLATYQRWDTGTNLFAGIALLFSLATRPSDGVLSVISYSVGVFAALVFISKPILKFGERIEKYTILHVGFADLFNRIETLVADIKRVGHVSRDHRARADEIFDRYASLSLREDADINWKQVEAIKTEVERAIPEEILWLPPE